jgi:hypothetical protein
MFFLPAHAVNQPRCGAYCLLSRKGHIECDNRILVRYNVFMATKICIECGRDYQPSSRHLRCPACRSRDFCQCGEAKQTKSLTCTRCRSVTGASNGRWKGGRTRHKAGYVMLWAPNHPRAGKGQYVFEHIIVMEQILGRHLLPAETVHHRNGVRDDNRQENLELWTRPQPTGIRVSDALVWAHEIIALYTGISGTSNNAQGGP